MEKFQIGLKSRSEGKMIINLDSICENGKVAVALIMSEITLDSIEQHNTEYKFCRDALICAGNG